MTPVVPRSWTTPSPARAEYAAWASQLAAQSAEEAQQFISGLPDGVEVPYRTFADRSASGGLLEAVTDTGAEVLVSGSSSNGQRGQVLVGSTADRLLHSSPVPVLVAPRGYRGLGSDRLTRLA